MKSKILVKIKNKISENYIFLIIIVAVILNLIIEGLNRQGVIPVIGYLFSSPLFFAFNTLILMFTLSISLFFKKKKFVMAIISVLWLALGVANFVVLSYRTMPFSFIDLFILKLDLSFLQSYLSVGLVLGILALIVAAVTIIIVGFLKSHATQVKKRKAVITISAVGITIILIYFISIKINVFEARISNMQQGYETYGFVTCFVRSSFERGIKKPGDYSENAVAEVLSNIEIIEEDNLLSPNIIYVQLESFFDPTLLNGIEFNQDPIPTFTYLRKHCTSGMLDVAVVGGGTANTEFEILTGMSLSFFGTGEYPYKSLLQDQTCESIAYKLNNQGYTTFALHNNTGTFYDRYLVYPNLGFDYFISSEFMTETTTTQEGWIKDQCLTKEIIKCLTFTSEPDFLFAVSVQGHGAFPEEQMENPVIQVKNSLFEENLENQVEYYVNQIHEMDEFAFELIKQVNKLKEPSIIVFYGDHIPSLEITAEDLVTNNNFQTEYVIWTNLYMEEQDEDITAYQLNAKVAELLGLDAGVMANFHQEEKTNATYMEELQLLQYDMIYGEYYALNEQEYLPIDMKMGVKPFTIETNISGDFLVLASDDFTQNSYAYIDSKKVKSEMTSGTIYIPLEDIEENSKIFVKQISPDQIILYEQEVEYIKE